MSDDLVPLLCVFTALIVACCWLAFEIGRLRRRASDLESALKRQHLAHQAQIEILKREFQHTYRRLGKLADLINAPVSASPIPPFVGEDRLHIPQPRGS